MDGGVSNLMLYAQSTSATHILSAHRLEGEGGGGGKDRENTHREIGVGGVRG